MDRAQPQLLYTSQHLPQQANKPLSHPAMQPGVHALQSCLPACVCMHSRQAGESFIRRPRQAAPTNTIDSTERQHAVCDRHTSQGSTAADIARTALFHDPCAALCYTWTSRTSICSCCPEESACKWSPLLVGLVTLLVGLVTPPHSGCSQAPRHHKESPHTLRY